MDPDRHGAPEIATFLVEGYWPGIGTERFAAASRRLADSVAGLRREGFVIQTVAALLVPSDEAAYWTVEAPSAELVARAWSRAGVDVDRIVRAVAFRSKPVPARSHRERTRGVR